MPDPQDRLVTPQAAAEAASKRFTRSEAVAAALSLAWLVAVAAYITFSPGEGGALGLVMTLLMVFLPIALIWIAVTTLRSVQDLRAEATRLQSAVEAMRSAYVQTQVQPSVEKKLEEIERATKSTETVLATFSSRRDVSLTQPSADRKAALASPRRGADAGDQPALALGTPAEDLRPPLSVADFIRALQFPESPEDKDGFRALRLALEDRTVAKLIRSAQDVLTLLSQEGIFMDDLKPDRARPELWRSFAQGERGRAISGLGGIRDRSSLALTAGRMREDPVFRDAAHHFLRTFDKTFSDFEKNASDAELIELADTRTARAFMLFGRVAGVFD
ncbi:hypothetical protein GCM10011452_20910 [Gemmobacter lanyuensis]|uniref:Uncharacterized protein n=1 Tax=Gemmobacter lanyuensis TaxID=1054497 RepID=A0A918MJJ1_9RHOB|nr:hypothetical protein [Gemmobacter lanyuensis]GGW32143.1 hypothetical protein GCM10011452_20910 [Gemmobacter lanyuensis]